MNLQAEGASGAEFFEHKGVRYTDFLRVFAQQMGASRYLEIGTSRGNSLAGISVSSIAVDPQFKITANVIGSKPACHFFQMTSDDFFARHDASVVLGGHIELAFLDGLHVFEYLLRDFMSTEKHCQQSSVIFLHDCLPMDFPMTARNRGKMKLWAGDVWKVVPVLKQYRPELTIRLIDCPPTGLVMITNLDPKSNALDQAYDRIVEEWALCSDEIERLREFRKSSTPVDTRSLRRPVDVLSPDIVI